MNAPTHTPSGNQRVIRAARGTKLSAKSWMTEAPLRMLMNNLDPEVAENPAELVVYGGIELAEMLPGRPVGNEVGICEQYPRRVLMGPKNADRLAGLDEKGLVLV